ncbi:MAG: acyl carrier protein [Lachnospiraceae bacterium]|nr:acyl carrier protein [Lachnospiraceae bacterium]
MLEKVIQIAEKVCETEDIELNADTSIVSDLELSSMELLAFIAEVERTMKIRIKEKELRNIDTLGELAELVEEKTGK